MMPGGAPRRLSRLWPGCARGAWLALCLWLAALTPGATHAQQIESARYVMPTGHYAHGVLGDAVEYSGLRITTSDGASYLVRFSEGGRVFEDIAPRLWDLTGDGLPEVVVIETDPPVGAQLAIYSLRGEAITKIAATPHIGQTNRWLAPIGATDLDGDDHIEIAYIDRPHLAKTLRIWRFRDGRLTQVATAEGLTNHKIGWDHIPGGIRDCGTGPEMITADAGWRRIMASTLQQGRIVTRGIARYSGPDSLNAARDCP
mgnify:CR=1 FL=1